MEEKTIEIAVNTLLPGIEDEKDACLERLAAALQDSRGIGRVHFKQDKGLACLCLHFDPEQVSAEDLHKVVRRTGNRILNRYHHKSISLEGLDCSDCALVVEHSLGRMEGVLEVEVDYAEQTMRVEYDTHRTNQRAIEKRVRQLGYELATSGWQDRVRANRELIFSLLGGLALLAGWTGATFLGFPPLAATLFYLAAYSLSGYDIARHGLHSLREKHFDTDLLMVLAALGAASLGEFAEGALLLFLFSLGHSLEERALDRARNAVKALAQLAPKTARLRRNGSEAVVPVDRLSIGETVIVPPGVRVPVDGDVIAGSSSLDQSPVTGESMPVEKAPGDTVFAGTVNGEGALEVRVTRLARDSTLRRVMAMVEQAQAQKSPTQALAERIMRVFVPSILVIVALVILIPPLFGVPFAESFLRAMTLLVAASPCALALATPSAVLSAVAQAARNGVLVKGGVHLENLGRLQALAFDKTGTLTEGRPVVTDTRSYSDLTREAVLALAAAVEAHSAHPLAQAIVSEAAGKQVPVPEVSGIEALTGRGIRARADGSEILIGSPTLFEELDYQVPEQARQEALELEGQGKSVILAGRDGALVGLLAIADTPRAEAPQALSELGRLGIRRTIMLSGDNPRAAAHIAAQLGMSEYRAGLLPQDKLEVIAGLMQAYQAVGMVGDGVNDAPALANATVGIAMGGAATDVALETADVALMAPDLGKLSFAIGLGKATRRVIQQNLVISAGVILVLSGLALAGVAGIGIAVLIHEGSTLLVALNALRLLAFKISS